MFPGETRPMETEIPELDTPIHGASFFARVAPQSPGQRTVFTKKWAGSADYPCREKMTMGLYLTLYTKINSRES